MKYELGDIVRLVGSKGLFEVICYLEGETDCYSVTRDECDTELYVHDSEIIFVCSRKLREDI